MTTSFARHRGVHRRNLPLILVALALAAFGLPVGPTPANAQSPATPRPPLALELIATLGPGAGKEISGIVRSRRDPGVFWTLNDSGDEPRVYPVTADGRVVPSVRYPDIPGTLIGGAINSDWEDIALDASGRLIVADFGNNSNDRRDLCLYLLPEPEPTEGRTTFSEKVFIEYPDQRAWPAPRDDRNFDAEAIFTVGDDIYILSKHRSDTLTKLYRLDDRAQGEVNTLTLLGRYDIKGQATGADASPDGLRLAVLTYDWVWLFERPSIRTPFFAGRVSVREYRVPGESGGTESICFESETSLLIADEPTGRLFRLPIAELDPASADTPAGPLDGPRTSVMSFNIRYAGGDRGPNAWTRRADMVRDSIRTADPDLLGLQEVEAVQADWLLANFPDHSFVGVGRLDGKRAGEFAPILFRTDRYTLLASGHFWLSPSPDVPGSRGWDAACERLATWARLRDSVSGRTVLIVNTHLDHVGQQARLNSARLIRRQIDLLRDGADVIVTGDFNTAPEGPDGKPSPVQAALTTPGDLSDSYRRLFPTPDKLEATFCEWDRRMMGDRIDWILASPELAVEAAAIERRMHQRRTPSDHFPVTAVLVDTRPRTPPTAVRPNLPPAGPLPTPP